MIAQVNGIGVACTLSMQGMDHEANGDLLAAAPALLAECRRQRAEIARLRAALVACDERALFLLRATMDDHPPFSDKREAMHTIRNAARAALSEAAGEGGAE